MGILRGGTRQAPSHARRCRWSPAVSAGWHRRGCRESGLPTENCSIPRRCRNAGRHQRTCPRDPWWPCQRRRERRRWSGRGRTRRCHPADEVAGWVSNLRDGCVGGNPSRWSDRDAQVVTGSATSEVAQGKAGPPRSWGTASPATLVAQTPARQAPRSSQCIRQVAPTVIMAAAKLAPLRTACRNSPWRTGRQARGHIRPHCWDAPRCRLSRHWVQGLGRMG